MNIAEQIAAYEAKRAANAARMKEIMEESGNAGSTLDASQQEEFDGLSQDNEAIDGHLKRLRAVEKLNIEGAKPVKDIKSVEEGAAARSGIIVVPKKLPPGIQFARVAKCFALAKGSLGDALRMAESRYSDDGAVINVMKAAVAAGSTASGNWAANLVGDETSVYADFVAYLRPATILGKFGSGSVPSLRRVPFRVPLISQTGGGAGYWVGEGKAKPLTAFDFGRTTIEPLKVANIAVLTMEVLRDSSPSAEAIVRDALRDALVERLDTDFINPAKAAAAGVSPASITNGAANVASTGTDADAVRLDVRAVFQKFIDANNAPSSGVWIMSAANALALSLMVNALGQPEFPGITMMGGTFFGLPVIVSEYAGSIVALVNASDIYEADDGEIAIDMSTEASLEMSDAPANNSTTPTAAQLVSMFQTNSVAIRAERTVNWARRRTSAVAYLTGVNWGGAVPAS